MAQLDWISLQKRRPTHQEIEKNEGWFLVYGPIYYRTATAQYSYTWDEEITHFHPLPEPPMED